MRVFCEENDPGFENWIKNKDVKVFLNGIEQKGCIIADSDAGMIKRYIEDENGYFVVKNGKALIETIYGKVEIQ